VTNPYEAPKAAPPTEVLTYCTFAKNVVLPDVCMKCGAEHDIVRQKKRYRYLPPGTLHNRGLIPIFNFLRPSGRREVAIQLPLCGTCAWRRRVLIRWLFALWTVLGVLSVLAMLIGGAFGWYLSTFVVAAVVSIGAWHLLYATPRLLPGVVWIRDTTITLKHVARAAVETSALKSVLRAEDESDSEGQ
jgi:hypothetical protein